MPFDRFIESPLLVDDFDSQCHEIMFAILHPLAESVHGDSMKLYEAI